MILGSLRRWDRVAEVASNCERMSANFRAVDPSSTNHCSHLSMRIRGRIPVPKQIMESGSPCVSLSWLEHVAYRTCHLSELESVSLGVLSNFTKLVRFKKGPFATNYSFNDVRKFNDEGMPHLSSWDVILLVVQQSNC